MAPDLIVTPFLTPNTLRRQILNVILFVKSDIIWDIFKD